MYFWKHSVSGKEKEWQGARAGGRRDIDEGGLKIEMDGWREEMHHRGGSLRDIQDHLYGGKKEEPGGWGGGKDGLTGAGRSHRGMGEVDGYRGWKEGWCKRRRDGRKCVALAVSLQVVVLGGRPAVGGEPIQSAVMESKVIVHSCKIAVANCLSR